MPVRQALRDDLKKALKERDKTATATIRSALAAIANAEAVPVPDDSQALPLGTVGLSSDVERRALDPEDVREILRAEAAERRTALAEYQRAGQQAMAERMRAELQVLARYVEPEEGRPS
ncbi:MAG: hypothetical protein GEU98_03335 [Pseudonocardiaceae bacterium]|nr:hypothetical protein [Pseudonocardiaceae bacterium]